MTSKTKGRAGCNRATPKTTCDHNFIDFSARMKVLMTERFLMKGGQRHE